MCQTGEKVLVVRHPILRIISAWNDKFNLNNTSNRAGLLMGLGMIQHPAMRKAFQRDFAFLSEETKVENNIQYF